MNKIEKLLPDTLRLVKENLADENEFIEPVYKGYISSFGAGIIQNGLLPTLMMYMGNDDKKLLFDVIYEVFKLHHAGVDSDLLRYVLKNKNDYSSLTDEIMNISVAVKLAIRTFNLDKQ